MTDLDDVQLCTREFGEEDENGNPHLCALMNGHHNGCVCLCGERSELRPGQPDQLHIIDRESTCPWCGRVFPAMAGETQEPGATGKVPVAVCTNCFEVSIVEEGGLVKPEPQLHKRIMGLLGPTLEELRASINQEGDTDG